MKFLKGSRAKLLGVLSNKSNVLDISGMTKIAQLQARVEFSPLKSDFLGDLQFLIGLMDVSVICKCGRSPAATSLCFFKTIVLQ